MYFSKRYRPTQCTMGLGKSSRS